MVTLEAYISTRRCDNQIRSKVPASHKVPSSSKQYLMQILDIAIRGSSTGIEKVIQSDFEILFYDEFYIIPESLINAERSYR